MFINVPLALNFAAKCECNTFKENGGGNSVDGNLGNCAPGNFLSKTCNDAFIETILEQMCRCLASAMVT